MGRGDEEETTLIEWKNSLPEETTVLSAVDTVQSILGIISLMKENAGTWRYKEIDSGGHMAVLTRPDVFNPLVESALR